MNDYLDRPLDARAQPSKPLVRGLISADAALLLAVVASVALLLLVTPLGLVPLMLGLLVELLGLAYDFGLKATPISAVLYAVYFPLIPLLAWSVFGRAQPFLPWALPLALQSGIAMNVANSLPDLEDDRAQGLRGLPHLLGLRRGLAVAWGGPVVALALLWRSTARDLYQPRYQAWCSYCSWGLLSVGVAIGLYVRHPCARDAARYLSDPSGRSGGSRRRLARGSRVLGEPLSLPHPSCDGEGQTRCAAAEHPLPTLPFLPSARCAGRDRCAHESPPPVHSAEWHTSAGGPSSLALPRWMRYN